MTEPLTAQTAGARQGEAHVAAVDGLRAFAVLVVMGTHFDVPYTGGGQLGVDVFFVLSGFLITTLLATERSRTGTVRWKGFYARRGLRLLPALWIAGTATLVMAVVTSDGITPSALAQVGLDPTVDVVPNTFGEVAIAFCYVANFPHLFGVEDVFFGHTWSLAIEEQFYLALPLIWWALARRRNAEPPWGALLGVALVLGALRVAGVHGPGGLIAFRIDELFLGCALAAALRDPRVADLLRTTAHRLAIPAMVVIVAMVTIVAPDFSTTVGRAEGWVTGVAAGLVVTALWTGGGGLLGRALTIDPLPAIGRISYGLYLCHLPIGRRLAIADLPWPGPAVVGLKVGLSFAFAIASYVLVERHALRLKDRFRA